MAKIQVRFGKSGCYISGLRKVSSTPFSSGARSQARSDTPPSPLYCSFSELSPSLNLTYTTKPVWKCEMKGLGQGRLPDNWTYTWNQWFICISWSWGSNSEQVLYHWAIKKNRWSLGGGSCQSASLKMYGRVWGKFEREWYGQPSWHSHRSLGPFTLFPLGPQNFQARLSNNKEQGTMTLSDFPGLLQGHSQDCSFGVPILSEQFSVLFF